MASFWLVILLLDRNGLDRTGCGRKGQNEIRQDSTNLEMKEELDKTQLGWTGQDNL